MATGPNRRPAVPTEWARSRAQTHPCPSELSLRQLFSRVEDGLVQLRPLTDGYGQIIDAEVISWNRTFAVEIEARIGRQLTVGTLLSVYAVDLQLTIEHISEAFTAGRSVQFLPGFEIGSCDGLSSGERRLLWQRIDDTIFGQVTDLSEYLNLQEQLADQRTLAAMAVKQRALAEDRERIARNLHDTVIQWLYAASLELELLGSDGGPTPEREHLGSIGRGLQQLIAGIRDEIFDVKRSIETGLREELLDVMLPMARTFGVEVEVDTDVMELEDADLAHNVRAVVREATSNAIRHGHASRVVVSVARAADEIAVVVVDNGIGMTGQPGTSSGLANLRRRAELMGGRLDISRNPVGGVRLRWSASIERRPVQMRDVIHERGAEVAAMTLAVDGLESRGRTGGASGGHVVGGVSR